MCLAAAEEWIKVDTGRSADRGKGSILVLVGGTVVNKNNQLGEVEAGGGAGCCSFLFHRKQGE